MDQTWQAWAAGLFEGEGSASSCGGRPRLQLQMIDEETVRRFADIVGCGKVYGPYQSGQETVGGQPRKPVWVWVAERQAAPVAIEKLWPWLSARRREQITDRFPVKTLA